MQRDGITPGDSSGDSFWALPRNILQDEKRSRDKLLQIYAIVLGDLVILFRPYSMKTGHLLFLNLTYFHVKMGNTCHKNKWRRLSKYYELQ